MNILAICGPTGVGKTKLSIELAKQFNGEIINCDSMQVYEGLDVTTNKVTKEENPDGIVHHMLSYVKVTDCLNVVDYREAAIDIIKDVTRRGKLPILVGGTSYYMENILYFQDRVDSLVAEVNPADFKCMSPIIDYYDYELLAKMDPAYAKKIHHNNRRKIRNALEVCERHQMKYTDYRRIMSPRLNKLYKLAVVVYIHASNESLLYDRLDDRVDVMHENGFIDEMIGAVTAFETIGKEVDFSKGVLQCIGLKEMYPVVDQIMHHSIKRECLTESIETCLQMVKAGTRKYTKRQHAWVLNNLAPKCLIMHNEVIPIQMKNDKFSDLFVRSISEQTRNVYIKKMPFFEFNEMNKPLLYFLTVATFSLADWEAHVLVPAMDLCNHYFGESDNFMIGTEYILPLHNAITTTAILDAIRKNQEKIGYERHCARCDMHFFVESNWLTHLKSKLHRKTDRSKFIPNISNKKFKGCL